MLVWARATSRATANCDSALKVQRKYEYRRYLPHYLKDTRILLITYSNWHRWRLPDIAKDLALDSCRRATVENVRFMLQSSCQTMFT